ncbi:MAG: 16S rRNA (uracil(1498)-N(3))-methyltransferase [Acidimicrobiia bacterium]|nr:16S rRNA (uracil(1498)-N(3))-methyltransferase [Acidimicrobiia bacterium]
MAFVADLHGPALSEEDLHHLLRVLRQRAGDQLTVADGEGRWRTARLDPAEAGALREFGPVCELPLANPPLAVGFALVKGDKPELIVQKLTELGIDRIVPFRAERSVVRWDAAKAAKAVDRLRLVARAAARQCHRPRLPEVADVAEVASLVAAGATMAERGGAPLSLQVPFVLVGPEGGWSVSEGAVAGDRVGLGPHVLRAETAAWTAAVLLASLRDGTVAPFRNP